LAGPGMAGETQGRHPAQKNPAPPRSIFFQRVVQAVVGRPVEADQLPGNGGLSLTGRRHGPFAFRGSPRWDAAVSRRRIKIQILYGARRVAFKR